MNDNLNIRIANLNDTLNIAVLKQQVWISTYAVEGLNDEFSEYVLETYSKKNIEYLIKDENIVSFIIENNNYVIGAVDVILKSKLPDAEEILPEITEFYLLEKFQGKGIGKLVLNHIYEFLKNENKVWLTVYVENKKAIQFYKKNGFIDIGKTFFEMNNNKYENRVMLKN